jgi:hypothetical protein
MRLQESDLLGLLTGKQSPPRRSAAPRRSGRHVARSNELRVVVAVNQFGHLRIAEIARAVWPTARYAEQLAARTVARLQRQGVLVSRLNAVGGRSFVISKRGAAWLAVRGHEARHTLDLSSVGGSSFVHRTLASRVLIERRLAGYEVAGEYALQLGRVPFDASALFRAARKKPDGLFWRRDGRGIAVHVLEVENSNKPLAELTRVLRWAQWVDRTFDPRARAYLAGLTIAFNADLNHAASIARAGDALWKERSSSEKACLEARINLLHADISPPLVWKGSREQRLQDWRRGRINSVAKGF